jgi:hypothetical protein
MVAVIAMAAPGLLGSVVPAHADWLERHNPVTYNMQGGTSYRESKWTTDVQRLLRTHDIVALQEAGPYPPGTWVESIYRGGLFLDHYTWTPGHITYHIYFMPLDPGNRVNLAMVTQNPADDVYIAAAASPTTYPSFGLRFGPTIFYTLHAESPGGDDAADLLNNINYNAGPFYEWAALGDFNRDPSTLAVPQGSWIYRSDEATHQDGGELDYMVARRVIPGYTGRRLNGMSSDHYPVDFTVYSVNVPEFTFGSASNVADAGGGRVLDDEGISYSNGAHIVTYTPNGGANQSWHAVSNGDGTYELVNKASGKCMDVNWGQYAGNGEYANQWDCQGQATQRFAITPYPDNPNQFQIRQVSSGRCLDVLRDLTGDDRWVGFYDCNGMNNQRWYWIVLNPSY